MVRNRLLGVIGVFRFCRRAYLARQDRHCRVRSMASGGQLDQVPDVDIDPEGKFKYILVRVYMKGDESCSKMIVRGFKWGAYHGDIYDDIYSKLEAMDLESHCEGGGRIIHEPEKKIIKVYGYSQGFGKADHSVSVELLKRKYPGYSSISYSDDGY